MPTTGAGRGRRTGRASMSPGNRRRLTPLPDELASPDEEQRRAFLAHFLQTAVTAARGLVIDRLLNVLGSGGEANRARAAAFSAVKVRLLRTRSPRLRAPWRNSSSGSASDCCPPASSTS